MIDLKVEEEQPENELRIEFTEEQKKVFEEFMKRQNKLLRKTFPQADISFIDDAIVKELHQLNVTLKEILREMRKRKI